MACNCGWWCVDDGSESMSQPSPNLWIRGVPSAHSPTAAPAADADQGAPHWQHRPADTCASAAAGVVDSVVELPSALLPLRSGNVRGSNGPFDAAFFSMAASMGASSLVNALRSSARRVCESEWRSRASRSNSKSPFHCGEGVCSEPIEAAAAGRLSMLSAASVPRSVKQTEKLSRRLKTRCST